MDNFTLSDIETVYFCSGARNHKLKSLFKSSSLIFDLDERSASFKALGSAKAGKLAAICVTSGTAVAECLPAMIEASYSDTPFILISADRPKRLKGTGAPQTIEHFKASSGYAAEQVEVKDNEFADLKLENVSFPLHINVLVDENHDIENVCSKAAPADLQTFLHRHQKTLFLLSHDNCSLRDLAESLIAKTDYVYAETLSGAKDLSPIAHEFELLKLYRSGAFDSIVRIGHTPLSKLWRVIDTAEIAIFSIDPRGLSGLSRGQVCQSSDYEFVKNAEFKGNEFTSDFDWIVLDSFPKSQMTWMKEWQDSLPENSVVYLGNSSVIRDFELVQTKQFKTYGNRGANGIDGQLSTAIGMARAMEEKVYCLLGDLTFLYDIGATFDLPENLEVVVLDNRGGRIFERVGIFDEIILSDREELSSFALNDRIQVVSICPEQTLSCFKEMAR